MPSYEFRVSLSISHPSIEPDEISDRLGITPKYSNRKGDRKTSRSGQILEETHSENYWLVEVSDGRENSDERSLDACLKAASMRLKRHTDFLRSLSDDGGRIEYFVGWFGEQENFSAVFSSKLLQEISGLGISLYLDVYGE